MEKLLMYPDLDADQSRNLIDWSLSGALSFHKIWFVLVDNF